MNDLGRGREPTWRMKILYKFFNENGESTALRTVDFHRHVHQLDPRAQIEPKHIQGRPSYVDSSTSFLMQLLSTTSHLRACDDRDRIFSLLGVAKNLAQRLEDEAWTKWDRNNGNEFSPVPIDYSKTTAEVYELVTKTLIKQSQTLDCLYCEYNDSLNDHLDYRNARIPGLPSWTPDWRRVVDRSRVGERQWLQFGSSAMWHQKQQLDQKATLKMEGYILGQVVAILTLLDKGQDSLQSSQFALAGVHHTQQIGELLEGGDHSLSPSDSQDGSDPGSSPIEMNGSRVKLSPKYSVWRSTPTARTGDLLVQVFGGTAPSVLRRRSSRIWYFAGFATHLSWPLPMVGQDFFGQLWPDLQFNFLRDERVDKKEFLVF